MPRKGDNYDSLTATAVGNHLDNVEATYNQMPQGASHTVSGIFQNTLIDINGAEALRKTFSCLTSDIPTLRRGDELIINTETYGVKRYEFNDPYRVLIILEEFD